MCVCAVRYSYRMVTSPPSLAHRLAQPRPGRRNPNESVMKSDKSDDVCFKRVVAREDVN